MRSKNCHVLFLSSKKTHQFCRIYDIYPEYRQYIGVGTQILSQRWIFASIFLNNDTMKFLGLDSVHFLCFDIYCQTFGNIPSNSLNPFKGPGTIGVWCLPIPSGLNTPGDPTVTFPPQSRRASRGRSSAAARSWASTSCGSTSSTRRPTSTPSSTKRCGFF